MHDLPWARTEWTETDSRPCRTVAEPPRATTLRFSARRAGRSMEPADGAECHKADARRHGSTRRLRCVPSALSSRAEILCHRTEPYHHICEKRGERGCVE